MHADEPGSVLVRASGSAVGAGESDDFGRGLKLLVIQNNMNRQRNSPTITATEFGSSSFRQSWPVGPGPLLSLSAWVLA